jgi:toxin-antitoxin system PIN domain toxin
VIAPDVNLLIYASDQDSPFHQRAKAWLDDVLSGTESIGFAWNVLLGFLRISTRAVPKPLTAEQALGLVALWLAQPNTLILQPGPRHFELLSGLLLTVGTAGNLTSDAHLAAVALEQDAEVYSADADFGRFPGLRWQNPLAN